MHFSVMLTEVMKFLDIKSSGVYIDATFGQGGHSGEILRYLNKYGTLFLLDKDFSAYSLAKYKYLNDFRVKSYCMSYDNISCFSSNDAVAGKVDGIIADLGLSYPQIKDPSRGFGFYNDGFLDMRLDDKQEIRAVDWINHASLLDLEHVFFFLGDTFLAKRIAKRIILYRKNSLIRTSKELCNLILNITSVDKKIDFNQIFQAIRIFVNDDLHILNKFLTASFDLLKSDGFLIVISFNSLEDAIVKSFFLGKRNSCIFLKPSFKELSHNCSSRSAIMRVLKR